MMPKQSIDITPRLHPKSWLPIYERRLIGADADAVLIYAWNEIDERLDAVGRVLSRSRRRSPRQARTSSPHPFRVRLGTNSSASSAPNQNASTSPGVFIARHGKRRAAEVVGNLWRARA
jgi:hypothetical protein